jgi:hypothetical protein
MKKHLLALGAVALGSLLLASSANAAVTIYAQGFSNNSGSNQEYSDYEWFQNSVRSTGSNFVIYDGAQVLGTTQDSKSTINNVNAVTPHGDNESIGIMFISPQQGTNAGRTFSWTNDSDIQVDVTTLDSVSFDVSRNTSTAGNGFRIAVQISDQWYVTSSLNQPVQATGVQFDGSADSFTFDWTNLSTAWNTISFVEGTSINTTLGTVASDLTGTVQSIGLYTQTTGNFGLFIDNYTVTAVPEPSTYAMLAGLLALGVVMLRRRLRD